MEAHIESKLSLEQRAKIASLRIHLPDADVDTLAALWVDGIFDGRNLIVPNLVKAVQLLGPMEVDLGRRLWFYESGVWKPSGDSELVRRVQLATGKRFRRDQVQQAKCLLEAREPRIDGLGPRHLINVKNGMLNWQTLQLLPHDPKYYSTYQLTVDWNPEATCPTINEWMAETFEAEIIPLLWQIMGVVIHPAMGPQKAIALIGDGNNGKGTYQRLCLAFLPRSAYSAIDPRDLAANRFMSAELVGKTANVCGDIERFTFNSTAEFKKITGDDPLKAERKNGHPFTFISQASMLFAGNKMPASRDMSYGWFRRWLIVPFKRKIGGPPLADLEATLHTELEGALVQAIKALRVCMDNGEFDNPEICQQALREYEYSCNSAILFINEQIRFSDAYVVPIGRSALYSAYKEFCRSERLEADTRPRFFETLEQAGKPYLQQRWTTVDERERGYNGIKCASIWIGASF
jgi:putative DNA primase/helicase